MSGITDRDRLRVEAMKTMRDLPTASLEMLVAVAKSLHDGLEIDDPETGVMRSDIRLKAGIKMECVRAVLTGEQSCEMRILYSSSYFSWVRFHRDVCRTEHGTWKTPDGTPITGMIAANLDVLYVDCLDSVDIELSGSVA